MKSAFQIWNPRQSWVYYQDLGLKSNILKVYCQTRYEIIFTLTPIHHPFSRLKQKNDEPRPVLLKPLASS